MHSYLSPRPLQGVWTQQTQEKWAPGSNHSWSHYTIGLPSCNLGINVHSFCVAIIWHGYIQGQ